MKLRWQRRLSIAHYRQQAEHFRSLGGVGFSQPYGSRGFHRFDRYLPMTDSLPRMISRRFALWQKAAAFVPVLLLLGYLPGEMILRCRIDGLLRSACCCPQQSDRQDSGPVVRAQDCCEREITQNQRPAAEAARPTGRDLAAVAT